MRVKLFSFSAAIFGVAGFVAAGTLELQPKETAPPTITQSEPWQFTIAAPGWMAGMDGTIGVRGVNANIDVGFVLALVTLFTTGTASADLVRDSRRALQQLVAQNPDSISKV